MTHSRRQFLRNSGIGLLSFYVGGCEVEMSPQEAREREVAFRSLTDAEVDTLEALGDVLLPGSAESGIAHFVDHQLAATAQEQLLMIKYLGVEPPFLPFYRSGLAALDVSAEAAHGAPFAGLGAAQRQALVAQATTENPPGWEDPPAPFFCFVVRNDAIDVVYGTQEGVESLGIPYMAHIVPPSRWGA